MKVGQRTYSRAFGWGEIESITDEYYEVKYDKIIVQYPHKDISKWVALVCLVLMGLFFSAIVYLAV